MPIYPFERMVLPSSHPSPFLGRGVKGPGGLVAADAAEGYDNQGPSSTNGRGQRATRNGSSFPGPGSSRGYATTGAQGVNAAGASLYHQPNLSQQVHAPKRSGPDRSVLAAAGALGPGAHIEKLPAETAKHFERDPETNEVLWFPAMPVDMARPTKPNYSLEYLHFLATKRKRDGAEPEANSTNIDATSKRGRMEVPPTVTETLRSIFNGSSVEV
ncbi:hypothetical protein DXG03_009086 [Asterophora parasitica]|uniref:Uncharacterized protein n=1 Tax=Asterophora parasitica TaxID=117018 RepID=A0A9P7G5A4_9AGAR|nr:hypothetical protein DXG03_009086 [Asterophora parasitica]